MKYRVAIEIPGVPVNETARWGPLAAHLEAFHGALGPVVAWRDEHVLAVIVATAADTPIDAVTGRGCHRQPCPGFGGCARMRGLVVPSRWGKPSS